MSGEAATHGLKQGERRNAVVLFSDMTGFTSFSEGRDPEELDRAMGEIFEQFEQIVRRHEGIVEKYIGDALVAVFGVPEVHEDDCERAISAALEFRSAAPAEYAGLSFRTGTHTGLVTTGRRGSFDVVTGHALAVASRLQESAEPGEILVSEEVAQSAIAAFNYSDSRNLALKGRSGTIDARSVVSRRDYETEREELFIGREGLLKELTQRYLRCSDGSTASVVLVGGAGMGTSSIARRFAQEVSSFPRFDAPVFMMRPSATSPSPYSATWNGLRRYLGVRESDSNPPAGDAIHGLDGLSQEHRDMLDEFLDSGGTRMDASALLQLVRTVLRGIIAAAAPVFPTVFIVDDADTLSQPERELLQVVFNEEIQGAFYLATAKSADSTATALLPKPTVLEVPPLTRDETRILIAHIKGGTPDAELVDDVHARTGGNPTFVVELMRYLEVNPDLDQIPTGIQTIVLVGLQSLSRPARELIRRLSVFTHPFRLKDARNLAAAELSPQWLEELHARGYLTTQGERIEYTNELVRNAIYSSLLRHNRRILHGYAADTVTDDALSTIVRVTHLVEAERDEEAIEELDGARLDPRARFDRSLVPLLDAIIGRDSARNATDRANLMYLRLAILINTNAPDAEVERSLHDLATFALETRDPMAFARVQNGLMGFHASRNAIDDARLAGIRAVELYERAGSSERTDQTRSQLAFYSQRIGDHEGSLEWIAQIEQEAGRMITQASYLRERRHYAEAFELVRSGLERARATVSGDPALVSAGVRTLGLICLDTDSWDELLELAALIEAEPGIIEGFQADAHAALAIASHHAGERHRAAAYLERARHHAEQPSVHTPKYVVPLRLARAELELGETDRARELLRNAYVGALLRPALYETEVVLEYLLRALENEPEEHELFLRELESRVEHYRGTSDYHRMIARWHRFRRSTRERNRSAETADALEEARRIASQIIALQGATAFADRLRLRYPYREILQS